MKRVRTKDGSINLFHGDCIDVMKLLQDIQVDMIYTDLPYGKTGNEWDKIIPFDKMWNGYNRLAKEDAAIVLHSDEPFTSKLVMSNLDCYRHRWIWNKNNSAGFQLAKKRPFQICEDILVFGKSSPKYYPKMEVRGKPRYKGGYSASTNYDGMKPTMCEEPSNEYYPKNLIEISNAYQHGKLNPTQKPLELAKYLIETYTLEGDTVLDTCMGSGTSAEACIELGRRFIGIDIEEKSFNICRERVINALKR